MSIALPAHRPYGGRRTFPLTDLPPRPGLRTPPGAGWPCPGRNPTVDRILPSDLFQHVTFVTTGDVSSSFRAYCDPHLSDDDPFCWVGPERDSLVDAVADAFIHDPIAPVQRPHP